MKMVLVLLAGLCFKTEADQHQFVPPQLQFTDQIPHRLYSTAHAQAHVDTHVEGQTHLQAHQQNFLIPTFLPDQHLIHQQITPDELVEEEWKEFKVKV